MLTDIKAKAAKPQSRPFKRADRDGLYLFVAPSGAKSWRFDYRLNGARKTLTIGRYPEVGLGDARQALGRARALVAKGISPSKEKQAKKADARLARANTFKARAEEWLAIRAPDRSASWRENARRWLDEDIYPAIGSRPMRDVTATDVENIMRAIANKRGAASAHYARLLIAGVFRAQPRALNLGNPARDAAEVIEVPKGKPKGAPLAVKDIPAFLDAADRYPGRTATKLAIRLLMLTFTRKRELVEASWAEVDLDRGEWEISAERMKTAKAHIVPLSRQAIECFRELKRYAGNSPFVFPNLGDPRRSMSASTLNKVFNEIGYGSRFTPHGARSTASTELNKRGWSADAIELQLAHTERNKVRAAYNHADRMEERRNMMQYWADFLDGLASGNVVSGSFGARAA
jgi:integrase